MNEIKCWWYNETHNIGDAISPLLISHFLNSNISLTTERNKAHLLGIGSIMAGAHWYTHIWGTGIMGPEYPLYDLHVKKILALRGRLTYSIVAANKRKSFSVPLGDPGWLIPYLPDFKKNNIYKKYKVGIIPHYQHYSHVINAELLKEDGVVLLNVQDKPKVFFQELQKCEKILSSSLHGLIFAEAYDIPNLWVEYDTPLSGGHFKFHDWFSLALHPQLFPEQITNKSLDYLKNKARLHDMQINSNDLIEALVNNKDEILIEQTKEK